MANETVTDTPQRPAGAQGAGAGVGTRAAGAGSTVPGAEGAEAAADGEPEPAMDRADAVRGAGGTEGAHGSQGAYGAGSTNSADGTPVTAGTPATVGTPVTAGTDGAAGDRETVALAPDPTEPEPTEPEPTETPLPGPDPAGAIRSDVDSELAPVPGRRRNPVARAARAVGRSFARDLVVFFSVPVGKVRRHHLMAIPATLVCVALIGLLWILEMIRPTGLAFVQHIAGVRQGEPLWQLLPQLPLSLFAPAPDLPAWGAMTQVLVAFGISECWLGWKKTLGIAMITSAVTSMAARVMVYASNWLHIGTPQIDNFQVDTGPSVAVVALLIYLALRLRTYWVVALTAVSMGGEAAILPNLAGREHLVAISLGIITYFLLDRWWPAYQRHKIERATRD